MKTRLLLILFCGALSACSSFDAKWRAAKNAATRWDGRWTSEKHHTRSGGPEGGRLRCVLESAGAGKLNADFHANWMIFASDFTMTLTPVSGSRTDFRGTHELPKIFGGTYRYTAHISGDHFTAHYDSSYDRGIFDLTRVRP